MPLDGEYEPSTAAWVREQVERYERSGGTDGGTLHGRAVVIVSMRGARTGKIRKIAVMRVEHHGNYAVVASMGGAPQHPTWYHNLVADPRIELQDGPVRRDMTVREAAGHEKTLWWERAVAAYPSYADYQRKTDREIPLFIAEPVT